MRAYSKRSMSALAVVATTAVLLVSACSSSGRSGSGDASGSASGGSSSGDLVIGWMGALTGSNSASGETEVNGMTALFNEVNSTGGIQGHKLVLKTGDDQINPALSAGVIRTLVGNDNILAAAVSGSDSITAVAPYLEQQQVVGIPATGPTSVLQDNSWPIRLVAPTYAQEAAGLVDYAVKTLHETKIAIAYTPDEVGEPLLDGAKAELAKYNMKPVAAVSYSPTATSGAAQAAALKASGAGFVIINHVAAVASIVLKADEQIGYTPDYGTTQVLANPSLTSIMGNALDGRIFFITPYPTPGSSQAADFTKWAWSSARTPTTPMSWSAGPWQRAWCN